MSRGRLRRHRRDPDVRRLLRALVFFGVCLALYAGLGRLGLFH